MSNGKNYMSNRHGVLQQLYHVQVPELEILKCGECRPNYWNYPESRFRYWCFYWNATPGAVIVSNGRTFELTPEKAVLIPPFTPFATEMRMPFSHFYVHFSGDGILERVRPGIIGISGTIAANCVENIPQSHLAGAAAAVYALLYQAIAQIPAESFTGNEESVMDKKIRKIIDIMYEHPGDLPGNRQLCRMTGMNINEFYTVFKKETGLSPRQYLLMLRMEHASQSLRHSKLSIDEIAEKYGFADRYHFSKSFRKYFGLPPVEFRRRHDIQV